MIKLTRKIKATLLVAIVNAMVISASAQSGTTAYPFGELIVGFTSLSGNDVVYDLGQESTLVDGETWNPSSLLTAYNLNIVYWGVVGVGTSGGAKAWLTYDQSQQSNETLGSTPPTLANGSQLNGVYTAIKTLYAQMPASSVVGQSYSIASTSILSWSYQTIDGPAGQNIYIDNYPGNPNVNEQGTDTPVNFYQVNDNGSAPTLLGTFTLNDDGTLVFNVPSVAPVIAINSLSVSGAQAQVHFTLQSGTATSFLLLQASTLTGPWTTNSSATLTTDVSGSAYHFTATTDGAEGFYRILAP